MNLRPRHNIRIASVLLINNQHAPRPSHLTFTPTSHLYTYISPLHLHLIFTPTSTASRIPTTLPRAPQAHAYYTAKFEPRSITYNTAKFDFAEINGIFKPQPRPQNQASTLTSYLQNQASILTSYLHNQASTLNSYLHNQASTLTSTPNLNLDLKSSLDLELLPP
jgi:hypothetical protein